MMPEASFTFTTPLNVNIVEIKGEEHLFVEGDISTNDIDMVNDIMTKECQESMQKQILDGNMKLDLEHEAFKGDTHEEKEIIKANIPAGKLIDATVKKLGEKRYSTRVKGEINRHNANYKSTKGNLMEGYLDAFSVAFLPTDITYEKKDGKKIRMLNDVKLLKAAMDVAEIKGTQGVLAKELFDKVVDGIKLTYKEYYIFRELIEMDYESEAPVMAAEMRNSHSIGLVDSKKLNKNKNSKMTDNPKDVDPTEAAAADASQPDTTEEGEDDVSGDADTKAMLKSVNASMKTLSDKYDDVQKDTVDLKEAVGEISKAVSKITEALSAPIHKSQGIQKADAENKAQAGVDTKSVDPLSLF